MDNVLTIYQRRLEKCQQFERKYRMTSDEFLLKFESGELDDSQDFFDWFAAKHGLDLQEANHTPSH